MISYGTLLRVSQLNHKWRLQKAFFTRYSFGSHGCRGISCKEFLPVLSSFPCCCIKHDLNTYPLKMSELKPVTPEYVNNIAIDSWRLNSSSRTTPPFAAISLSPRGPEYMVKLPQEVSIKQMALSPEQNEPFS
ncbi:hypothetical protein P5673_022027 [Acropora cervicornis]|uniref:Uncharacterized protein n=1 Tax=Acropora cervicornis TaxID=6130 RepID=A0AAD9Q766_ACRCE|nr:hypothetical protein P5673_022027 [Acropora cervicornis]